jgi:hypothetical protein
VESEDWEEKIEPALMELVNMQRASGLSGFDFFKILRCIIQIVYVLGYFRGKKEKE